MSLRVSTRVAACLGTCRKNLGACRDLFLSVLMSALMLADDALGPCQGLFWSVLVHTSVGVEKISASVGVCFCRCRWCVLVGVGAYLGACQDLFLSVLLRISMRVGDFLDPCQKNLGTCRDLFRSVLVCVSMRVDNAFGWCRRVSRCVLVTFSARVEKIWALVGVCFGWC